MINKFIKDPIVKEIDLDRDPIILELISTKEFKRLENIMQLGVCWKLFPVARHNRLTHSLGVYEIASRFLEVIDDNIDLETRRLVQVAALLHDLGHGPLSHVFERFGRVHHEAWTEKIITSEKTEINKILRKYNVNINELILIYKNQHPKKWVNQIISSDLDIDRIDYLLRDSYFAGTHYGTIDLYVLLRRVKLIDDTLAFSIKSLNMIESFLLGRVYMNIDIYENKNLIVYEWILELIFARLAELKAEWPIYETYISSSKKYAWIYKNEDVVLEQYLEMSDLSLLDFINELPKYTKDDLLKKLLRGFENGENFSYINLDDNTKVFKINSKGTDQKYIYAKKAITHKSAFSKDQKKQIVFYDNDNQIIEFQKTKLFPNLKKQVNISKIVLLNNNFID
ncbi:MAG: HD domain-containing protein [Mycoplasmoidaceae bacterium]